MTPLAAMFPRCIGKLTRHRVGADASLGAVSYSKAVAKSRTSKLSLEWAASDFILLDRFKDEPVASSSLCSRSSVRLGCMVRLDGVEARERDPDLHARHGRGHLPRAGCEGPLRHLRMHWLGRREELGRHRPRCLRGSQRQRRKGRSGVDRRLLRPRRRPHRPESGPLRARPVQAESVGFLMPDWEEELGEYLKTL